MKIHAVIDTNVIVSSMLTRDPGSPTKYILSSIREGRVIPMTNPDIIEEYRDVLSRCKFNFSQEDIEDILNIFNVRGIIYIPECLRRDFIDLNDVIFYETYLIRDDAYLVTGNLRHFPHEPRILPPADMVGIINLSDEALNKVLSEPVCEYMSQEKQAKLQKAWEAFERMRASAVANGIADMSMEEIDEEIRQYREGRITRSISEADSKVGIHRYGLE